METIEARGGLISDGRRENDSFDREKSSIMDGNSRKSENFEEHLSTDSDGKGSNRESFDVYSYGTKDEMEIDSYGVYNRFKDKGNNNGWIQKRLDRLARDPYCD